MALCDLLNVLPGQGRASQAPEARITSLSLQVKDEEGRLMNDFTGRIKRDEWKPPTGATLPLASSHCPAASCSQDLYGW